MATRLLVPVGWRGVVCSAVHVRRRVGTMAALADDDEIDILIIGAGFAGLGAGAAIAREAEGRGRFKILEKDRKSVV